MKLTIGGVPEHFNLPWRLAIEEGAFAALGLDVEWVDFDGGTGPIMEALDSGAVDLATPLTEGAITAIANGNSSRIIATWVDTPLLWGVHVAAGSTATSIEDLEGQRFAISRFGSGSELMSRVLAEDQGWSLDDDSWVIVGNLAGATDALPAGEAEIFLWNKSMTQPLVDNGTLGRVGLLPTPWPSFTTTASAAFADGHREIVDIVTRTGAARAAAFTTSEDGPLLVVDRYGLALETAQQWFDHVQFTAPDTPLDTNMLRRVEDRMRSLGRIS